MTRINIKAALLFRSVNDFSFPRQLTEAYFKRTKKKKRTKLEMGNSSVLKVEVSLARSVVRSSSAYCTAFSLICLIVRLRRVQSCKPNISPHFPLTAIRMRSMRGNFRGRGGGGGSGGGGGGEQRSPNFRLSREALRGSLAKQRVPTISSAESENSRHGDGDERRNGDIGGRIAENEKQ